MRPTLALIAGDGLGQAASTASVCGDVHGFFRLLRALEGSLAPRACRSHTAESLDRLRMLVPSFTGSAGGTTAGQLVHRYFHHALLSPAQEPIAVDLLDELRADFDRELNALSRIQCGTWNPEDDGVDRHLALLEAFESGDPVRAREAIVRHTDEAECGLQFLFTAAQAI